MKTEYEVKFTNAKGHDLYKAFIAHCWNDALDDFRKWNTTQGNAYKFVGVKGVHY